VKAYENKVLRGPFWKRASSVVCKILKNEEFLMFSNERIRTIVKENEIGAESNIKYGD
jgi:hypothetical protein